MDLSSFYSQFRDETAENMRVYAQGLLALENLAGEDTRRATIDAVFRAIHTVKGSARLLGFEDIGKVAHTCEHILGAVRENRRTLDQALTDDLLRGGDAILELVAAAAEGRTTTLDAATLAATLGRGLAKEPAAVHGTPAEYVEQPTPSTEIGMGTGEHNPKSKIAKSKIREQTVRVRVDRLDKLLNLAGELAVERQGHTAHLAALEELADLVAQHQRALLALESELRRLRFSQSQRETLDHALHGLLNGGERAGRLAKGQLERFGQYAAHSALLVEGLEQEVMAVRLLPISTLFANLPRAVRELARDLGREVSLVLAGETTELDRKVIEALADPLTHLVRNALDHGIELPDEREQAGKPRAGTLTITAQSLGSSASLTIHDDGRGMDPQRLREAAVRKGLLNNAAAAALNDHEALELVFMPGFSTAQLITDVSGRGVGMDVVRTNIAELGGQIQIASQPGQSTTVTLVLPLTLMTTRVLLVEAAGQFFGLPAAGCQGTAWVRPEKLRVIDGRTVFEHGGVIAPVVWLGRLLELEPARPDDGALGSNQQRLPALLLGTTKRLAAVVVDRLVDEREVVVKPLGPLLEQQRRYGGAIQLGDGRVALLLNPAMLERRALSVAVAPVTQRAATHRPHLLVTDDSFATRELIRSILQSAGYEVATAVDGLDALDKLQAGNYDLVVSDVEMPRVDGFALTSRIRSELGMAELPVIIMTSLASEEHRRRGLEAGAQAYIVKSQFNQSNLLETIRQLLGGVP
jgi:two-component system, chemotaxis family, sensor kinase CheA